MKTERHTEISNLIRRTSDQIALPSPCILLNSARSTCASKSVDFSANSQKLERLHSTLHGYEEELAKEEAKGK